MGLGDHPDPPFVETIARYLFDGGGKRIRPLLLILSSWVCGYQGPERILLATVIEYIHTATLLHDDVIDEAPLRRGRKAPRLLWGNQASILVGDYLYTLALCHTLSLRNHQINETIAEASRAMTRGELLQLAWHGDLRITEKDYLEIIGCKTAALMSAACRMGALLGNAAPERLEALTQYGWYMGLAFQLADDTLDYVADRNLLGKSLGKDLQEGKITLPLLHLLQHCQDGLRHQVQEILHASEWSEGDLQFILERMQEMGSLEYALQRAREFAQQARDYLKGLETTIPGQALNTLTYYVVDRDQ